MGRFSDGISSLIIFGNYGNGWIPLIGCSEDTSFHLSIYPYLPKIKLPQNIYSSNSDEWTPSNGVMNFQKIRLDLDSLSSHSQIQFKFLAKYYYGGLIFLDNFHITNLALTSIRRNDLNELKIYPNPAFEYINIETKMKFSEISISNCLGLPVACSSIEENKSSINTSSFSPGIYYIRIKQLNSENYTYSLFIVK